MKKFVTFIIPIVLSVFLAGCPNDAGTDTGATALTLKNQSFSDLLRVEWQGDYNWSNQEYTLEAGSHEIAWTKHGYYLYYYTPSSLTYYSYFSLDNILVVYVE